VTSLFASNHDDVLPPAEIERILILRTAQLREVDRARAELTRRYPDASIGVLGTRLKVLGAFEDCVQFEVTEEWLSPRSVRPLRSRIEAFAPDLVVMCLNNDCGVGYGRTSRVVRSLPASHKVVAAYNGRWHRWSHADFATGHPALIWLVDVAGLLLLYPLAAAYLLCKPSGPRYAATPRSRPRQEARA
jgi:hypothetical protein